MNNIDIKKMIIYLQLNTFIGQIVIVTKELTKFCMNQGYDLFKAYSHTKDVPLPKFLNATQPMSLFLFIEPGYEDIYRNMLSPSIRSDSGEVNLTPGCLYELIPIVRITDADTHKFNIYFHVFNEYYTEECGDTLHALCKHIHTSPTSDSIDISETLKVSGYNFIFLIQNQKILLNTAAGIIYSIEAGNEGDDEFDIYSEVISSSIFLNKLSVLMQQLPVGATTLDGLIHHFILAGHEIISIPKIISTTKYKNIRDRCINGTEYKLDNRTLFRITEDMI